MLGLKLNRVSKRGTRGQWVSWVFAIPCRTINASHLGLVHIAAWSPTHKTYETNIQVTNICIFSSLSECRQTRKYWCSGENKQCSLQNKTLLNLSLAELFWGNTNQNKVPSYNVKFSRNTDKTVLHSGMEGARHQQTWCSFILVGRKGLMHWSLVTHTCSACCQKTRWAFVEVMACCLFSIKPLPEPMLTYWLDHQEHAT